MAIQFVILKVLILNNQLRPGRVLKSPSSIFNRLQIASTISTTIVNYFDDLCQNVLQFAEVSGRVCSRNSESDHYLN